MALRRRAGNGLDAWPGYVDALSTLLMVTIFVLLVFVLAEAFLSSALTGSDNTITQLRNQIAELSNALSLQAGKAASLQQELAALNAQLAAATAANASLTQQLTTAQATAQAATQTAQSAQSALQAQLSDARSSLAAAQSRLAALQTQMTTQAQTGAAAAPSLQDQLTDTKSRLAAQTAISQTALAEADLLNQQLAALRLQLAMLAQALDAAQAADAHDNIQITDLGKQLNEALARKVEELQQYRSEFFGTLRQVLADNPNIRIVGDRFVFESDVLFPVDQATLTPAGQAEIADVAKAIKDIASKIPPNINWVLSVDGYADAQPITGGPFTSNFDLSAARALAVLHLLVTDGVPEPRLSATAYGSSNPITPGTTKPDYAQNRRIEFRLTAP